MSKLAIHSTRRLNSGYEIPLLALGVYQTPAEITEHVTGHAIKCGYRHVDSAVAYRNEEPVAHAMKTCQVPRGQLYFTTKVPPKAISYEGAKRAIDETLDQTGLGYVDLYLLHAPFGGKSGRIGAWTALVEAVENGKIRSIGVSNYGVSHLEELEQHIRSVEAEHGEGRGGVLSVNQVELHPWLPRPDIVSWCEARGVVMEAYSPLTRAQRLDEPVLRELARKHSKTPGQILLRWGLQKGFVILPKSVNDERIEENCNIYDFELKPSEMEKLNLDSYAPTAWDPTKHEDVSDG